MPDIFTIIDIIITGFGGYCVYAAFRLQTKGVISDSIMLSKDLAGQKCYDLEGYKAYMVPRTYISGGVITLLGILSLIDDFTGFLGKIGAFVFIPVLVVIIWFCVFSKKATNTYFVHYK